MLRLARFATAPAARRHYSMPSATLSLPPRPQTPAQLDALSAADADRLYRPFLTRAEPEEGDWVQELELDTVTSLLQATTAKGKHGRPKVLILYGSLRARSFSRLFAFEAARILHSVGAVEGAGGCDVRVYSPIGLPVKDDRDLSTSAEEEDRDELEQEENEKVKELRALSEWSEAMLWVTPEMHGTLTGVFKNQIDWIPLSTGSVRPTQGRTLAVCQVNGGSQSFNAVNQLRQLGRWMRMWTIPNQSSLPFAFKAFSSTDRLLPSSNRDRLVDVCEELIKATLLLRPHRPILDDRYSERKERGQHGRLRTQEEVEREKDLIKAATA